MKKFVSFIALIAISLSSFAQEDCVEVPTTLRGTASVRLTRYVHKILPGVFSVGEGKYVIFSQGNLQYQASTNTWRFAEEQWTRIGKSNENISSSYTGWIDLFGWGTSGYNSGVSNYEPWSTGTAPADYCQATELDASTDWAQHNIIINGGMGAAPATGVWSVLTEDEWTYIFEGRTNASSLYCFGNLNGNRGLFLLPDNWNESAVVSITAESGSTVSKTLREFMDDASFASWVSASSSQSFSDNQIARDNDASKDLWSAFEKSGVVFLPTAGQRDGADVTYYTSYGFYWTATGTPNSAVVRRIQFSDGNITYSSKNASRALGHSVRPVYRLN